MGDIRGGGYTSLLIYWVLYSFVNIQSFLREPFICLKYLNFFFFNLQAFIKVLNHESFKILRKPTQRFLSSYRYFQEKTSKLGNSYLIETCWGQRECSSPYGGLIFETQKQSGSRQINRKKDTHIYDIYRVVSRN